jgi:hypothetical protein
MGTIVPATSSNLGVPALGAAIITLPSENSELGALWRRYDARPCGSCARAKAAHSAWIAISAR